MSALESSPFCAIQPGPHGPTMHSFTPALDALKQAAYLQNILRRCYTITDHGDGAITVQGDGLAALTFANTPLTVVGA